MKTVDCPVCGSTVSKRSTLFVQGRRICRWHEEAENFVAEAAKALQMEKDARKLDEAMEKLMRDSMVRVLRDIRALDPGKYRIFLTNIYLNKGFKYRDEIQKEVEAEEVTREQAVENIASGISAWVRLQESAKAHAEIRTDP